MTEEQTIISPAPEALTAERTQIAMVPGADVTQVAMVIECPVCHTANPPGDRWCQDCGFLLTSQAPEAVELPASSGPRLVLDGREFELHAGANTIGRVGADVLLPDPTVSRHHATLTIAEDGAWIEDAGSTNGTSVNGAPVTMGNRSRLHDGDKLKLGSVTVNLVWPEAGAGEGASSLPAAEGSAPLTPSVAMLVGADGHEIGLRSGVTSMGRRAENGVVLTGDPYVSGRHAEIRCDAGGCVLVDVGSTNGTFIQRQTGEDEERLRSHDPQSLADGDTLRLGQTAFTFHAVAAESEEGLEGEQAETAPPSSEEVSPDEALTEEETP